MKPPAKRSRRNQDGNRSNVRRKVMCSPPAPCTRDTQSPPTPAPAVHISARQPRSSLFSPPPTCCAAPQTRASQHQPGRISQTSAPSRQTRPIIYTRARPDRHAGRAPSSARCIQARTLEYDDVRFCVLHLCVDKCILHIISHIISQNTIMCDYV